ncbi:Protein hu-li tai shao [Trichoplax sp. H2]|nr:Protein hu-li tai shao [Trichoplax sp. H2]|eukprot:RDD43561.1 Protein hu-li tai shao [Trichoplax sp. H2]
MERKLKKSRSIEQNDSEVKGLKKRKPVTSILDSQTFRKELESITQGHAHNYLPTAIKPRPNNPISTVDLSTVAFHRFYPIADLSSRSNYSFEKGEKNLRCKLACVFRLIDILEWEQCHGTLITSRISMGKYQFLANPYGLSYQEISARKLLKVNGQGQAVDLHRQAFLVDQRQFVVHQYVYTAKPETRCIIHLRTPTTLAISATKAGLLPLCQEATEIFPQFQFNCNPTALDDKDRQAFVSEFARSPAQIVLMKNNGFFVTGLTVEEAFYNATRVIKACDVELSYLALGLHNLHQIPVEIDYSIENGSYSKEKLHKCKIEFEAYIRNLDMRGCRTGYYYRLPDPNKERLSTSHKIPSELRRIRSPPTSIGYKASDNKLEENALSPQTLLSSQTFQNYNQRRSWFSDSNIAVEQDMEEMPSDHSSDEDEFAFEQDYTPEYEEDLEPDDDQEHEIEIKQLERRISFRRRKGSTERVMEQRVETTMERRVDHAVQQRIEHSEDHKLEHSMQHGIEHTAQHTIQQQNIMEASSTAQSSTNYSESQYQTVATKELRQQQTEHVTTVSQNWTTTTSSIIESGSSAFHIQLGQEYQIVELKNVDQTHNEYIIFKRDQGLVQKAENRLEICQNENTVVNISGSQLQKDIRQSSEQVITNAELVTSKDEKSLSKAEDSLVSNIESNYNVNGTVSKEWEVPVVEEAITVAAIVADESCSGNIDLEQPQVNEDAIDSVADKPDFSINGALDLKLDQPQVDKEPTAIVADQPNYSFDVNAGLQHPLPSPGEEELALPSSQVDEEPVAILADQPNYSFDVDTGLKHPLLSPGKEELTLPSSQVDEEPAAILADQPNYSFDINTGLQYPLRSPSEEELTLPSSQVDEEPVDILADQPDYSFDANSGLKHPLRLPGEEELTLPSSQVDEEPATILADQPNYSFDVNAGLQHPLRSPGEEELTLPSSQLDYSINLDKPQVDENNTTLAKPDYTINFNGKPQLPVVDENITSDIDRPDFSTNQELVDESPQTPIIEGALSAAVVIPDFSDNFDMEDQLQHPSIEGEVETLDKPDLEVSPEQLVASQPELPEVNAEKAPLPELQASFAFGQEFSPDAQGKYIVS